MATTVAQFLPRVRRHMADVVLDRYVWTDTELIDYVNDARRLLWSRRPDAFTAPAATSVSYSEPASFTATTDNVDVNEFFFEPLALLVAAQACLRLGKNGSEISEAFAQRAALLYG